MRATGLSSLTILALVYLWQPALAQDSPPDGGKGASPARLGTLSPDEARRAERARKRRAGATKPAEAAAPPPPAHEAKKPPPEPTHVVETPQRRPDAAPEPKPAPVKIHSAPATAHRDRIAHVRSARAERRRVAARHEDQERDRWSRNRRTVMNGPRWTPRVGDVVPSGVPLYPLRPAYGYAPVYGYEPRGWAQPAPVYGYPQTFGYGYADE